MPECRLPLPPLTRPPSPEPGPPPPPPNVVSPSLLSLDRLLRSPDPPPLSECHVVLEDSVSDWAISSCSPLSSLPPPPRWLATPGRRPCIQSARIILLRESRRAVGAAPCRVGLGRGTGRRGGEEGAEGGSVLRHAVDAVNARGEVWYAAVAGRYRPGRHGARHRVELDLPTEGGASHFQSFERSPCFGQRAREGLWPVISRTCMGIETLSKQHYVTACFIFHILVLMMTR